LGNSLQSIRPCPCRKTSCVGWPSINPLCQVWNVRGADQYHHASCHAKDAHKHHLASCTRFRSSAFFASTHNPDRVSLPPDTKAKSIFSPAKTPIPATHAIATSRSTFSINIITAAARNKAPFIKITSHLNIFTSAFCREHSTTGKSCPAPWYPKSTGHCRGRSKPAVLWIAWGPT